MNFKGRPWIVRKGGWIVLLVCTYGYCVPMDIISPVYLWVLRLVCTYGF